jgi:hypothetical protein
MRDLRINTTILTNTTGLRKRTATTTGATTGKPLYSLISLKATG